MSTTINSKNNTTSTSNSRSSKKSSKKAPAPKIVAQSETVISTPVKDVEITVTVTENVIPTPVKDVEVTVTVTENASSTQESTDNIDTNTSASEPETKPVINAWKLRAEVRAAEEALKKASEELEKPKTKSKPKSEPKLDAPASETATVSETATASETATVPAAESEGWTKVAHVKKAFSKPKTEKTFVKSDKPKEPFIKSYKPKEPSAEQLASRELKNEALLVAQDQLIAACLVQMPSKIMDRINTDLQYIKDYRRIQVFKFEDDFVVAEVNNDKFEFSRTRFFENRIFQHKMREKLQTIMSSAWISFFPGREENTYCISISKYQSKA